MDQRLTQSRGRSGRSAVRRRERRSAADVRVVQGRSIERAERVDLIEVALPVHGHGQNGEERAQHEDTASGVAIVLMDSRAPGREHAERGERAHTPRGGRDCIEAPHDEADQERAQRGEHDHTRPDVDILDLWRKLEHLPAESSVPSFLGGLARPEHPFQQPLHRYDKRANSAPVLSIPKYPDSQGTYRHPFTTPSAPGLTTRSGPERTTISGYRNPPSLTHRPKHVPLEGRGRRTKTMTKRILTPIDGRVESEAIVPVVAALARGAGSTVRLLRVFPVPEHVVGPYGRTVAYVDQEMARLTAEGLDELGHIEAEVDGVPVERVRRFGEAAEEIRLEAEAYNADLVTLATTRRSRLGKALAPGVAERLEADSTVPTLVLRG